MNTPLVYIFGAFTVLMLIQFWKDRISFIECVCILVIAAALCRLAVKPEAVRTLQTLV